MSTSVAGSGTKRKADSDAAGTKKEEAVMRCDDCDAEFTLSTMHGKRICSYHTGEQSAGCSPRLTDSDPPGMMMPDLEELDPETAFDKIPEDPHLLVWDCCGRRTEWAKCCKKRD